VVQRNVMATDTPSIAARYPADNQFPLLATFTANFQNIAGANYSLIAGSPYVNAGTDSRSIGCDAAIMPQQKLPTIPAGFRLTKVR
jgi:hypothetical protein